MNIIDPYIFFLKSLFLLGCFLSLTLQLKGQTCVRTDFRTINGTCNNLLEKNRGRAKTPFLREIPAEYGPNDLNKSLVFPNRPNPRAVSNAVFTQGNQSGNDANLSSFVFTWAQFLDHDLTIAQLATTEPSPIVLPPNEPNFTESIAFNRSAVVEGTGIFNPRNQENELTAWMDGSQVYGSDIARANWLRTFHNGKMKTSAGNRLPYNTTDGQKNSLIDPSAPEMDATIDRASKFFVAGDVRAFEQPGLTSLHTLFVREHNRICNELVQLGYREDEYIYQVARKRVGALIQAITYQEFLPAFGVRLDNYSGYQPWVQPEIMNLFATAAYRLGHTMVTDELLVLDDNCLPLRDPISLDQAFLTTKWIESFNIEPILKGLVVQQQEEVDAKIVDGLRNFLFVSPQGNNPFGLDLASLNIQRGRDHGIPNYKTVRSHFLGQNIRFFNEITTNSTLRQQLKSVYNRIEDIDLWVGLLAEDRLSGSILGPTLNEILKVQFERIRNGDFYFYQNDPFFSFSEKNRLTNTTLSDVIKRNTLLINIPNDVFRSTSCQPIANNTCNDAIITATTNQVKITNLAQSAKVEISGPSTGWGQQLICYGNCQADPIVNDLSEGKYAITIQTFNPYCYRRYEVTVSGNGNPCDAQGGDSDGDGICDNQDNCDFTRNTDQADNDGDGIGNACDDTPNGGGNNEADCNSIKIIGGFDDVSISNISSNAKIEILGPSTGWGQQLVCEGNCNGSESVDRLSEGNYAITVQTFNPYCYRRYEVTVSGNGNACDDSDGDGICNNQDNCDFISNVDQADNDRDGIGNACDDTPNGGGASEHTIDCGETIIQYGSGQVQIKGQEGREYFFKINDLNNGWVVPAQCGWNCGNEFIANNISNGRYLVTVYNADWSKHCETEMTRTNSSFIRGTQSRNAPQLAFTAYPANRKVKLQWLTNSGYKISNFEVEHSIDGENFNQIAQFVNKEWADELVYHQTTDKYPATGMNYYRVKEIYLDGSTTYTAIQRVGFHIDLDGVAIFPNPAQETVYLNLKPFLGKQGELTITNQFGQAVKQIDLGAIKEDLIQINTSEFLNGLYYLNIRIDSHVVFTKKVLIHKLY